MTPFPTENFVGRSKIDRDVMKSEQFQAAKKFSDIEAAQTIVSKLWSGNKTEQIKGFLRDHQDVLFISQPSTSRTNVIPIIFADQLNKSLGVSFAIGDEHFSSGHRKEVKLMSTSERTFERRIYIPYDEKSLRQLISGKNMVVVDDVLTSGASAAEFIRTSECYGGKVISVVALMGDKRLNIDQLTKNRLDTAFKNKAINISTDALSNIMTRSQAGRLIQLVNQVRTDDARNKITERIQGLLDQRPFKGLGRDTQPARYKSPARNDPSDERILEGVKPWALRENRRTAQSEINNKFLPGMPMEIDRFKTDINLIEFAAENGYQVDRKESSRNSVVMRLPSTDDKIIIARGHDNHWTYFSVRDPGDNGSIIDFVQKRNDKNLGEIRKELRPWIGKPSNLEKIKRFNANIEPSVVDRSAVKQKFVKARSVYSDYYLKGRGIKSATIRDPRFDGMIRQDERRNILFPHHDREGLAGFEIKNKNFTGYSRFGVKSVWHSRARKADTKIVICESAIDALSYHQIRGDERTRYMSTGGQMSPYQEGILKAAIAKMPPGSEIIAAFDRDIDGDRFAAKLKELAPNSNIIRHAPAIGKDWNEQLQLQSKNHHKSVGISKERSLGIAG